jgi:hypothetical protein
MKTELCNVGDRLSSVAGTDFLTPFFTITTKNSCIAPLVIVHSITTLIMAFIVIEPPQQCTVLGSNAIMYSYCLPSSAAFPRARIFSAFPLSSVSLSPSEAFNDCSSSTPSIKIIS